MTGLEALQGVQFVSAKGKRFAVLSAEDWEVLIEWLETVEDIGAARQALAALRATCLSGLAEQPASAKTSSKDNAAIRMVVLLKIWVRPSDG